MKQLLLFLLYLISISNAYALITVDELDTIENNNNFKIKLLTEDYLIYSTYYTDSDKEKEIDYFVYDFSDKQKLNIGKYKGTSAILPSENSFYLIQTTSSGVTSYNLREYRIMIGAFDSSTKKINFILDKKFQNFTSFDYQYYKSKDGDFIISFTSYQSTNYNNKTQEYSLENEFYDYYKLKELKIDKIIKIDYANLKDINYIFENENFLIRDNIVLNKQTNDFITLKRTIYSENFCGIQENIIFLNGKEYPENSQTPENKLQEYDYILNKQINSTKILSNCIHSNNYYYFNDKLTNFNTNEYINLDFNKEIIGMTDNTLLFQDQNGIYVTSFNKITYNNEEITQFVNKSLNLYNYNNLNELRINVNNLYNYYYESIINDYTEDFKNINTAENTYLTLTSNCKSKTLNEEQINLCANISTKITTDYNNFNSKINYEITDIKLISENLIEVKIKLNLTGINNLNENILLKIKKSKNGYLITDIEPDNLYFNINKSTEFFNFLTKQNELLNNLKYNNVKTTYIQNDKSNSNIIEEPKNEENGLFAFFIFFLILILIIILNYRSRIFTKKEEKIGTIILKQKGLGKNKHEIVIYLKKIGYKEKDFNSTIDKYF